MTDPLEIFSEITCEKIMSYLAVKDLLNCSLLNKRYYEFISNTPSCMNRLKINFIYHKITSENFESLKIYSKSRRKYQHYECFSFSIDFFNAIIPNPRFRTIKMRRVSLHDGAELLDFLTRISPNIEDLRLERYIETNMIEYDACDIQFPKLKHLELHYMPDFFYKMLSSCTNLRELRITGKRDIQFYTILRLNKQLKRLAIVSDQIDNFFEENLSQYIQFKLAYFEARDIYNLTLRCIENFKKFLECQMYSLEEIDLGDWIAADIVKMIFHMPKLRKLTFKGFHNIEEHVNMREMKFHKSQSITTLHLIDTFSKFDILQAFIEACPNVRFLKLYSLKNDAFKFLSESLPNLKSLEVDLLEIDSLNNTHDFLYLEEFKMKIYHSSLKICENTCNNFERLVQKEIYNYEQMNKVKFIT